MPLTDAVLVELANLLNSTHLLFASLHTADPGSTGANPALSARQQVDFNVDADGDLTLTVTENFTGGAANGPCTHMGLWDAAGSGSPPSGGTFKGGFALTGDQTFNAAGQYNLTGVTINLTAT